ncbi:hypothetical protein [uncultured Thiohalocapsa sp.]|uniref:hypothetical protein n=1 Tax=uncultured Thiohalocapsa sp. TaxID=768990 RepID=UPI0025E15EA8|nr:hypothetical protein [uncultured Thiohalocapsa sp.]
MSAAATDQATTQKRDNGLSPLGLALIPLLVLFAATVVLFWLSQRDMSGTYKYWEIFVPVVAVVSLVSGWTQAYVSNSNRAWYLLRQVIHWGALIGLLYLLNSQGYRELMTDQQYTALMIYLLALGTLLAAVQMDIKLIFFSAFLAFCAFLIAVPADNPTLIATGSMLGIEEPQAKPVLVSSAVAVAGFIGSLFVVFMMRGALIAKRAANKRKKAD